MPTYNTPGVYVNESPLTSLTAGAGGTAAAAFWGTAARGPVEATAVSDWGTYKTLFGDLEEQYDLGYAVYHYFANGGRVAYVTRVAASDAVTATVTMPWYPVPTGNLGVSQDLMVVNAIAPGVWGNSLSVTISDGDVGGTSTNFPTFDLSIELGGTEVERWVELSPDPNASRFVQTVVNNYSKYINVVVDPDVFDRGTVPYEPDTDYDTAEKTLTTGADGTEAADTDFPASFSSIDTIKGNLILNAVGQTSTTITSALIGKAESRGDSFVILDPLKTDASLSDIQTTSANFSTTSSYAAAYAPALTMVDPGKTGVGAVRTTYPGGALAGLYVRTEVERSVAKTPAGYDAEIRGALAPVFKLTDAEVGTLYNGTPQVNTFRAVAGAGITVNGGRTLQKVAPDKFISVRRTLNYLKASLEELTAFAVFEPNDDRLWTDINVKVSGFLADFWRNGGLKGASANEAFFVVCDGTNNTAPTIDQGEVHVDVGVALQYPAEFVVITLSQWSGGSNVVDSL